MDQRAASEFLFLSWPEKRVILREIARFFDTDLAPIQRQLIKLEINGVLASRLVGRTRLYSLSPRYAFKSELEALLAKALDFYPSEERERLLLNRRRPRRSGKPL